MTLKPGSTRNEFPPKNGFTIVELLIVIIVIAILATIVIVAYGNMSRSAARSVLKSDVSQSLRLLLNNQTEKGFFPSTVASMNPKLPGSVDTTYEYTSTDSTFCLTASSTKAQQSLNITESGVIKEGVCSGHYGLNPPPLLATNLLVAGFYHACTLVFNEAPYCWGRNDNGQLGQGNSVNANAPTAVTLSGMLASKRVTAMSAGMQHTCAVASGKAYCWGTQFNCVLGIDGCSNYNSEPNILSPAAVSTSGALAGKTVTAISSGNHHVCALADGDIYCWGDAQLGKLGGGFGTHVSTVVSMPRSATVGTVLYGKTISSFAAGYSTTCATAEGAAYCWGADNSGTLGNGTANDGSLQLGIYTNKAIAVDTSGVLAGKNVSYITVGNISGTACAIADGAVYCWGQGTVGQLGNGLQVNNHSPVAVDTSGALQGKTVTDVDVGDNGHVCAIANGAAYCWGENTFMGALGDGTTTRRLVPTAVSTSGVLNGKRLVTIKAGYEYTCALSDDNKVFCWGRGTLGQLGNGTVSSSSVPVLVSTPAK